MAKTLLAVALLLTLTSCSRIICNHGNSEPLPSLP